MSSPFLIASSKQSVIVTLGLATCLLSTQLSAQAPIIQPGAPGQPSRVITAEEAMIFAYSAIKNIANFIPENSVL